MCMQCSQWPKEGDGSPEPELQMMASHHVGAETEPVSIQKQLTTEPTLQPPNQIILKEDFKVVKKYLSTTVFFNFWWVFVFTNKVNRFISKYMIKAKMYPYSVFSALFQLN